MLAHALQLQIHLMTMPVSKERIQTDAGVARTEAPKIAVQKGDFFMRFIFSWTDDLYNAAIRDSGIHEGIRNAQVVCGHT